MRIQDLREGMWCGEAVTCLGFYFRTENEDSQSNLVLMKHKIEKYGIYFYKKVKCLSLGNRHLK